MFGIEAQIQRQECEAQALVLLDVPDLVRPERVGRLAREYEHVPESDRSVATSGKDEMRETAVAHIQEAAVTETRTREREPAERVSDRVGVVRDEPAR